MENRSKSAETVEHDPAWAAQVPLSQLEALRFVAGELQRAGVEAVLGGAFAIARHIGRWRGTKDIDFFIRPADRDRAVAALTAAGFSDYFEQLPYDRSWIYRAYRDDALVDLIWTVPNHMAVVDDVWFDHAVRFIIEGAEHAVVPIEELIWIKLFVLQRDRCDWPDVINLLRCNAAEIDWERLLARVDDHEPLLGAVLRIVEWITPSIVRELPGWVNVHFQLGAGAYEAAPALESERAALLDSRPWYAAILPHDAVMSP